MSSVREDEGTLGQRHQPWEKPAIAVPVTGVGPDTIARVVLRAADRGHPVLLVVDDERTLEPLRFEDRPDVHVVHLRTDEGGWESLATFLERLADEHAMPGVIFHDVPAEYVDYGESGAAFEQSHSRVIRSVRFGETDRTPAGGSMAAIPAYDEESTIGAVVSGARRHVDRVIVIDDCSTDATAQVAAEAGATVVRHRRNRGYGAALKSAFREADRLGVETLVILDGDGQHTPDDIPRLIAAKTSSEAELVIGSRFLDGGTSSIPAYRRLGLWVINNLTNLSLGVLREQSWVTDTQSGFRAYDRRAIRTLARDPTIGNGMNASTDILHHVHRNHYAIEEVGIVVDYDVDHGSSQHPLVHGVHLLTNIIRTIEHERPMTLIGVPGFLLILVGLLLGYATASSFLATGLLPIGTALGSALLVILGTFSCFISLVLHSINTHLRRFETEDVGRVAG